uniref:Eukaryotic translation initiation factor 3 subunit L n=1 Tax=Magallana gigas TaxID=29159 RepID=A0A8W8MD78_MAGGI
MWGDQADFPPDYYPPAYPPSVDPYEMHTGDPRQDIEFERQYQQSTYIVPDIIKSFLTYFQKSITEQNVYEIQNAYENGFNKLTERFFKTSPWPEAEVVAPIVQNDHLFLILYKELFYRHIYARVQNGPTLEQRFESYYNYCNLFNYILNADGPVHLELPNQWLWDIIDEFIYQFQCFSIYRCKVNKKSEDEISFLRSNPKIWNVHSVLNVLHSLVDKSNINKQLEVYSMGGDPDSVAGEFGQHSLYKMLGYFSLVGLLRLHSLLGDYYQALKILECIDFNKKSMYSRVPACQITKMNDKMYTLLAICLVLHPMRIDESVHSQLREKFQDKMLRMQKGDTEEFTNNFSFACPKFLSPVPPNYDAVTAINHKEPFLLQLRVFMEEVTQQIILPTIRSFLKLYTTLPLSKLAIFMDMTEDELKTHLMCFKHKMKNLVWTKGTSGLEGEFQSASEVDFYIDKDMIHIADTKVARRYGDFFIRQIHKFEEITRNLKVVSAGAGKTSS